MKLKSVTVFIENKKNISEFLNLNPYNNQVIYSTVTKVDEALELIRKLKSIALKNERENLFFYLTSYEKGKDIKLIGTTFLDGKLEEKVILDRKNYMSCEMGIFDEEIFHTEFFKAINLVKMFGDKKNMGIPLKLDYLGAITAKIGEMEDHDLTKPRLIDLYSQEDVTNLMLAFPCSGEKLFAMLQSFPYLWRNLSQKNYSHMLTITEKAENDSAEAIRLFEVLDEIEDKILQEAIILEMGVCFYINREMIKENLAKELYNWLEKKILKNDDIENLILNEYQIVEVSSEWKVAFKIENNYDEIMVSSLKQVKDYMEEIKNIQ